VSHGLCENDNDCNKKQLFFFASGKDALHISLYSITDTEVIRDIVNRMFLIYEKNNASITIAAYEGSHPVNISFFKKIFFKNKPFFTMLIKEKL
jgi:hypothetical protein